ncbi:uncharacterized protein [Nicotiana sylvestris]|uniref:Zinc transport protein ZntB-like isoform X1 n=4 Tax=Nicotiana TaxID=4085 RepID=A0A1S4BCA1_TOBAC|nr:PREDICTED: uncharacterized protein LOC104235659 isoform X1 [Nicotiana sylvestris]XP_009787773.1 PREDICTED: uncharacterized protein LOC104235659 isoform X1 [Nicotiana sylvestris]XP_009787774.1 PREDICTED: uncharacterized protein LOC104235659 isoform X1 [Nicotiana sylvestris]XP_016486558.1 PREDICTED: zinc transport protein ZntB-like isoform X1 [Nicotiana tabacum]XP_016486559.1 PREDICTED: zinc transport protein ZntB-like isoform X1 [Nicotiana tabacum]XP_016486560.1 PREDICTED: zinc transport pro
MKVNKGGMSEGYSSQGYRLRKPESNRGHYHKDVMPGSELWTDGLICAFEFVSGQKKIGSKSSTKGLPLYEIDNEIVRKPSKAAEASAESTNGDSLLDSTPIVESRAQEISPADGKMDSQSSPHQHLHNLDRVGGSRWIPIGWARIFELVQTVQADAGWSTQQFDLMDDEDGLTVADLAAPYWERPAGPIWWCHVTAGHPSVDAWLSHALWLHPAISIALRDEGRLISEKMKHLLYEVPVRVAGGLLFELLGQSAGDPYVDEDDIPVVTRSWQAQNFLVTVLHVKGSAKSINVLGITEVQELLLAGGYNAPRTVHEVIAHLASRLARWDDRLFRKSIFGGADEVELKFVNRRNKEDLNLLVIILNQEIRRLSRQVIRVKWSLHAREEIVFELLQHLRGNTTRILLEGIRKSTREMIEEQEAVRGRIFTIQDVMQSNLRAWLQDKSLRVSHNLAVFGGCGLVLTIITGLFGINVDGIPGAANTPYAFGLFSVLLVVLGIVLIAVGLLYLGLKKPISEEQVEIRKLELQELVNMFQHEAETHAQVHKHISRHNLPPTAGDKLIEDTNYALIQ